MTRHMPTVRNGTLHEDSAEKPTTETIGVESSAWYAWLEHHHSFRFEHPASPFTARKEQRSGNWYWYAYRRQAGRLHTAYLGRSAELSAMRLEVIAAELVGAGEPLTQRKAAIKRVPDPSAASSHEQANVTTPEAEPLHNLPRQLTSLVGREQEVASAEALLRRPEVRLLSMVGTPGVGKTRLALQVATDLLDDFPDGVFFVALAPLRDPDLVLSTMAQTLGLRVTGDQSFLEVLKAYLYERHCLLVLDNFEQVIGAAPQLPELLRACPDVKLLVTSREVLHLRAEHQFSVPPLALPDRKHLADLEALTSAAAMELFLQRAQAIDSAFQVTMDNAATIAEICIRLDGLPLAIELAAARIKVFTPRALLARLDRRLHVLMGGARDLPERQRTLRNTIAWSYELLPAGDQRLFRRLAVFVGGCTLEAVEAMSSAVGDTGANVLEGLISLVNKSLLQQIERDGQEPRFAMLETIREYGLEALASAGEAPATYQAHAAYYLALAEQAEPGFSGPQQLRWFEQIEQEHDNLGAALSWLLEQGSDRQSSELALRFSSALHGFWATRGYASEGRHWLERVLEISRGVKSAMRAKALIGAARLATLQDDFSQAETLCVEGLALYRELGDRRGSATALSSLGFSACMRSHFAQARLLLEEAVVLFREVGDSGGCVFALENLASVLFYQGEYARVHALLEESLELSRQRGDTRGYAASLLPMGIVLLSEGNLAQAQARFEESLAVSRKVGFKWNIATSIHFLGLVTFLQGDVTTAHSLLEESLALFREVGDRGSLSQVLFSQGFISFGQGEYAAARTLMEQSLEIARELDRKWDIVSYLEGLAAVAVTQGEPERAVWFMSAAQAGREAIGTPLQSLLQAIHKFTITSVRTQLGEQAFAAAWAEGRSMPLEQILAAPGLIAMPTAVPVKPSPIPHAPKALTSPNGLTARELEVLRLLAQGLTSAQIAERLVIGLVTVNSHVRSIYNKLGVTSRAAATRYAIKHGLV